MYSTEDSARRRPLVLGLIIIVHLALGFLFFTASGPKPLPKRGFSGVSGSAGVTLLTAPKPDAPARKAQGLVLSFDRTPLIGPSSVAPPSRPDSGTHKVAPSPHPS